VKLKSLSICTKTHEVRKTKDTYCIILSLIILCI